MPKVSIVMPIYKAAKYLPMALDSAKAQSETDWELLMINDCSPDKSADIMQQYADADPRFKCIHLEANGGAARARNKGIELAQGRYIAFLDSDDCWLPNKLERQLQFMDEQGIDLCYASYALMDEAGQQFDYVHAVPHADYYSMLAWNKIGNLTAIFDTETRGKPLFNTEYHGQEDYVYWVDMFKAGAKAAGVTEVLARYRITPNSLSSNKLQIARDNWRMLQAQEGLNLFQRLWYFAQYAVYGVKKYFL